MLIRHTSYRSQSYHFRFLDWFYALIIGAAIFLLPVIAFVVWLVS